VTAEITYGLERLAMYIQGVNSVFDLEWCPGYTYGDVFVRNEREQSQFNFELADTAMLRQLFDMHEAESARVLAAGAVLPAYEQALKCSHYFNLLDARGAIAVTERVSFIGRIRTLAKGAAEAYVASVSGAAELAEGGDGR